MMTSLFSASGSARGEVFALADSASVSFSPAFHQLSLMAVLAFFAISLAAIIYLYRAQRRIASPLAVTMLTLLRIMLVGLVFVILLQPTLLFTHKSFSNGTLWLMLDQSESMGLVDPQSSPAERLHWAEALDLISPKLRPSHPDLHLAALRCLRDEFVAFQRPLATLSGETDPAAVAQFLTPLNQWHEEFSAEISDTAMDAAIASHGTGAMDSLADASRVARAGLSSGSAASSVRDAAAAIDFGLVLLNLDGAIRQLEVLAAREDAAFLASQAGNYELRSALAKVGGMSRSQLTYQLLTAAPARDLSRVKTRALVKVLPAYHPRVASIADGAQSVPVIDSAHMQNTLYAALSPMGNSTNLSAGFQLISEQTPSSEPAAVLLLSDGRQNTPGDPAEIARLLAARNVRTYSLLVGSREVSPDVAVEQTDAPDWIYKNDALKAAALIRLDGVAGQTIKVDFLRGGEVLSSQYVTPRSNQETQRLDFSDTPPEATASSAAFEYSVRAAPVAAETNKENNVSSFRVAVKKDKLYALLVEDQPRWEFRYLSSYLSRDPRLKSQTVLLKPAHVSGVARTAPVMASAANSHVEAQLLPDTKEGWQAFDFIVLGDISPTILPSAQQQLIAAAVRDRGATLIVIAGQNAMPQSFANSPLADILPVSLVSDWAPDVLANHRRAGFHPTPAPEGVASILTQFSGDTDSNSAFWARVPDWYWHSECTNAKPAASVLWSIAETASGAAGDVSTLSAAKHRALLSTITVGAGRVLYLASDQTWRLRNVGGENLQDRFWGQVIRWAVGNDLPAGGKYVRFGANKPRYSQGDPLAIKAHVLHEDLTPYENLSFDANARVTAAATRNATSPNDVLSPDSSTQRSIAHFTETPSAPGYYSATLTNVPTGTVEISLSGPEVERLLNDDPSIESPAQKTLSVMVMPAPNLEARNTNTDAAMLHRISSSGGGAFVDAPYLDILLAHLPAISHETTTVSQFGFFTNPNSPYTRYTHLTFLGLFILIVTAEWILRKRSGMI